jgi:hypothetical protein
MTRGKRELRWSALAVAIVLCGGCASFRAGHVEPVMNWPPAAPAKKKSISVAVSCSAVLSGKPTDAPQQVIDLYRQRTWAAYEESGQFSDVRTGLEPTDLRAEVRIEDRGDPHTALAVLSGLTMTLIPAKASDELTMRTTFKDAEGNTLATIEKSETINTWIQMFLVFVMPAKFPTGVVKGTISDLNRATIDAAHAQNIF